MNKWMLYFYFLYIFYFGLWFLGMRGKRGLFQDRNGRHKRKKGKRSFFFMKMNIGLEVDFFSLG